MRFVEWVLEYLRYVFDSIIEDVDMVGRGIGQFAADMMSSRGWDDRRIVTTWVLTMSTLVLADAMISFALIANLSSSIWPVIMAVLIAAYLWQHSRADRRASIKPGRITAILVTVAIFANDAILMKTLAVGSTFVVVAELIRIAWVLGFLTLPYIVAYIEMRNRQDEIASEY